MVALIYNVRHGISRFVLFYEHVNRCDIQPVQRVFLGENFLFTVDYESKLVSIFPQKCQILLTAVFFFQNSMQSSLFRRRLGIRAAFEVLRRRKVSFKYRSNVDTIGWVNCTWNPVIAKPKDRFIDKMYIFILHWKLALLLTVKPVYPNWNCDEFQYQWTMETCS